MFWGLAALNTHPSKFWSVTLQPLGAGQTTIQKLKGDINSFHRRYKGFIYYKRLQSYKVHKPLVQSPLVVLLTFCANVLIEWMEGREGGKKGGHTGTGKVVGSREVEPPAGCKRLRTMENGLDE